MMEVKGEGRLDKVTEKKLRIGNKERKKERKRERKKEREKERKKKKKTERKRGKQEEWIDYTIEGWCTNQGKEQKKKGTKTER